MPATFTLTRAIQKVLDQGSIAALATLIESPSNIGAKILVEETQTIGSFGESSLNAAVIVQARKFLASRDDARTFSVKEFAPELTDFSAASVFFERLQPEPHVVICGAGHVGAAVARLSSFLGYRATLIEDRAEFLSRTRFPDERIDLVATNNWTEAVRTAVGNGRGISVAIVTRGHNEDEACIRALVGSAPDYIGLIGSKRRTNIVLERLRDAGASVSFIESVFAPIGLDIGAVTPEEVALAIMAEIVAVRRGGPGGSLSAWRRKL
jgi:xanthine dehydrogenase accessory factor